MKLTSYLPVSPSYGAQHQYINNKWKKKITFIEYKHTLKTG